MQSSPNSERRVRFDFDNPQLNTSRMESTSAPSQPHARQEEAGSYFAPMDGASPSVQDPGIAMIGSHLSPGANTGLGSIETLTTRPRASSLSFGPEGGRPSSDTRRSSGSSYSTTHDSTNVASPFTSLNPFIPAGTHAYNPRRQALVEQDDLPRRSSLPDNTSPRTILREAIAPKKPLFFYDEDPSRRASYPDIVQRRPFATLGDRRDSLMDRHQQQMHAQPQGSSLPFVDPRSPDPGAAMAGGGSSFVRSPIPNPSTASPMVMEEVGPYRGEANQYQDSAVWQNAIQSYSFQRPEYAGIPVPPQAAKDLGRAAESVARYNGEVEASFNASPYMTSNYAPSPKIGTPRFPFEPAQPPRPYDPKASTPRLRPALRQSHSEMDLSNRRMSSGASLSRGGGTSRLEEGGVRAHKGVFGNLFRRRGLSSDRRRGESSEAGSTDMGYSRSRANSYDSGMMFPSERSRNSSSLYPCDSTGLNAEGGRDFLMEPDDPRITKLPPNHIDQEKHAQDTFVSQAKMSKKKKKSSSIKYHIASLKERQQFILKLAHALMRFGAPSHRLESQLSATARILEVDGQFVHLPSIIIASFGEGEGLASNTYFVKVNGALELGRLHTLHNLYRRVVHDEVGVQQATKELNNMIKAKPIYGLAIRCTLAALCAGLICPLAFGGSVLDMAIAAVEGAILAYLQLGVASKNAMYSNVFEISVAILMSFIARALSSIPSQIFCYSAISSAGVVLVLPGYMILCSALELASKNIVSGSVKLTFAIVYSLFLGFGLTIGSDLYYLIDPRARRAAMIASAPLDKVVLHGSFRADNNTDTPVFAGSFTFTNSTATINDIDWVENCYRNPDWPWYLQPFPVWSLVILVPLFSTFSSSWSMQPLRSKQLPVMVLISCCSFAANKAANHYIFNRSDVVSAIGAFVIGILGNLYSRVTKTGTSFTSMVTGVLFLVPAGIAATGGLSMNYRGQDGDEYSNGLAIGLRMIQVAIGITVGLFGSSLVVYSFGRSKKSAIFAF